MLALTSSSIRLCLFFFERAKENPAKGRVSRFLLGRVALFPLREETLLTQPF